MFGIVTNFVHIVQYVTIHDNIKNNIVHCINLQ